MSFDTLAPYYRTMEFVAAGGVLQRCRTAFLAETVNSRRALLLGEGPGRFLVELLRTNPRVEVTCVERSPRMIAEAQKGLDESELARVQFVQADALTWQPLSRPSANFPPPDGERAGVRIRRSEVPRFEPMNRTAQPFVAHATKGCRTPVRWFLGRGTPESQAVAGRLHGGFDLIVTHFFLDCFRPEELAALVAKIAESAAEDAQWLLTDFREPESGWRRWRGRAALALMYGFFRVATGLSASRLTPPDPFFETAGFRLASRRLANFGLAHSDLWLKTKS